MKTTRTGSMDAIRYVFRTSEFIKLLFMVIHPVIKSHRSLKVSTPIAQMKKVKTFSCRLIKISATSDDDTTVMNGKND
jgi:hypothetical protein